MQETWTKHLLSTLPFPTSTQPLVHVPTLPARHSMQSALGRCLSLVRLCVEKLQQPADAQPLGRPAHPRPLDCLIFEPHECVTNCSSCSCCMTNDPKMQQLETTVGFLLAMLC